MAAKGGDLQADFTRSDELYEAYEFRKAFAILEKYSESDDPEVLWRLIRIYYRIGNNDAKDEAEAGRVADTALALRERVSAVGKEHFLCQKVCSEWSDY